MNKNILLWMLTLILLSSFAFAAVTDEDITDKMVEFWKYETVLSNEVPENTDVTFTGTVSFPAGKIGHGVQIDTGERLTGNQTTREGTGSYAFMCWAKFSSVANDPYIFSSLGGSSGYELRKNSGSVMRYFTGNGASQSFATGSTTPGTAVWYLIGGNFNNTASSVQTIFNGNFEGSGSLSGHAMGTGAFTMGIRNDLAGTTQFLGIIDECMVLNDAISQDELTYIYNSGAGRNFTISGPVPTVNLSITVTDSFDNSALGDVTANITFPNGSSLLFTNATGNFIQTFIPINASNLVNISLSSTDYFNGTFNDYNLSTNLAATLNQSFIEFELEDVVGNPIPVGNITILGQTENLTFVWNLKAGLYNVTANAPTFNPKTEEINISALDVRNITIGNMTNVVLNITAIYSLTGATVLNFTINATGITHGYNVVQSTTNGEVLMDLVNDTYLVKINAPGFVLDERNISVQVDTDFQFSLFQIGDLRIDIFNTTDGTFFTQNVTLKLQNASSQRTFNLVNGSDFITGLNYGVVYTLIFSSPGFSTNLYNILYDPTQNLNIFNAYLTVNNTQEIVYRVTDTRDVNQEGALVVVERFVNDTRVEVGSQLTDVTGQATFFLDVTEGVRITITKSGFTEEIHNLNAPLSDSVTFQITFIAPVNYTNRMTNIVWSPLPTTTEINPDIVNFTLNINAINNDLIFSRVRVFNGTTLIASLTDSNSSGGVLILPVNVTNYINNTLIMEISFQKAGFEVFVDQFVYIVVDSNQNFGSFLGVRLWFQNNTDLKTRVQFWLMLFALGSILIASGSFALFNDPLKGIPLVMPYILITGWLVAINFLILGFLSAIMLLGIIFSKRSGGLEL